MNKEEIKELTKKGQDRIKAKKNEKDSEKYVIKTGRS